MKKAITHCLIKFGIDHLVYFSRIGVVGCGGQSYWEELVGEVNHTTECVTDLFIFWEILFATQSFEFYDFSYL